METSFLSFFVVKLKQIHIDKGITAGYSTNILQCYGNACASSLDVSLDYVQWTSCEGERVTIGAAVLCW